MVSIKARHRHDCRYNVQVSKRDGHCSDLMSDYYYCIPAVSKSSELSSSEQYPYYNEECILAHDFSPNIFSYNATSFSIYFCGAMHSVLFLTLKKPTLR